MENSINKELINFANNLADQSAIIAKKYYRLPNGEIAKEDDSPVTMADREIELMIRDEIQKKFPNHGIVGEEYQNINEQADYKWIIDPIDGTSSFIIGRPIFGTLIALCYKNKPIFGIINQPISGERWLGIKNQGAYFYNINDNFSPIKFENDNILESYTKLNLQKIKTRNVTNISDAVMCASSPHYFQGQDQKILSQLSGLTKYQRIGGVVYGGDCYSFACLAMGFVDIIIEPGLKCYDYAATQPIIEEAGGIVSDWFGKDLELKSNAKFLACSNKILHEQIITKIDKILSS